MGIITCAEAPPPGNACCHMDDEQVLAAVAAAMAGSSGMLEMVTYPQHLAQSGLDETAMKLAEALHAALSFMPGRDEETNQLLSALDRWLP
jgi:hypothetical protein